MNSEKVSVNISDDKLARIDLLVSEGFYSNRSAFINEAVSQLLDKNASLIEKIIYENNRAYSSDTWFIGVRNLSVKELEDYLKHDVKFSIKGFGVMYIDRDVTAELLEKTVSSVSGKIKVHGSAEVLEYINTVKE